MRNVWEGFSERYSKVNNRYIKSYYPEQELKHILYLDTNNLYGYAMSKHGTIIQTGLTCKKLSYYMRDAASRNPSPSLLKELKHFEIMLNIF